MSAPQEKMVLHTEQMITRVERPMTNVGGFGDDVDGNEGHQQIANVVRPQVEAQLGSGKVKDYTVVKARSQLVNGYNYMMKVRTAPDQYIHVRIYVPFTGKPEEHALTEVLENKKLADKLE